jgi:HPt (histidine-containing phosphotransfer) domain-containing protein
VEISPPLLNSIREACDKNDTEALWHAAHSLKSSAGALGAKRVSRHCAEIGALTRACDIEATRPLVTSLGDDMAAAVHGLQALIGEMHVPA